jgi:ADP-ribosylglycohydrolase
LPGAQAKADDELIGADSLYSKTVVATFPSSIHALLKHSDDFETAILAIIRAGGDSAGRASMVGAWLGAHLGTSAIPEAWRTRLSHTHRISAATEKILADLTEVMRRRPIQRP